MRFAGYVMTNNGRLTLFALDCGATNWRLYRVEYRYAGSSVEVVGEPQPSPLTSFIDRKLPAILCLNAEGTAVESFGEIAQQQLDNERNRERVREHFKPCIGVHLETNPLPHQKRYTHAEALTYTGMLLRAVLDELRQEKWRSDPFDDRVCFTFAYPVHWRFDHEGSAFRDFEQVIQGCLGETFHQPRFMSEPEGAILSLQRRGLLERQSDQEIVLVIDVGGSTTDIIAGQISSKSGKLKYLGRYGEPFGGSLYDAELAKYIADELNIPGSALADDPSALVTLRMFGQRLKESLSRQMLHPGQVRHIPQRAITLVMRNGTLYRKVISLSEADFMGTVSHLDNEFSRLIENALKRMSVQDSQVGQVILVGGGAQLFTILGHLRERFGSEKLILADNPEETVVHGIGLEYGASFETHEPTIIFPDELRRGVDKTAVSPQRSGWKLILADGTFHSISLGTTTIGRGETNKASRFHAELRTAVDDKVEIIDLNSTNGTFVNGERLTPDEPHALQPGDEVVFARTKFIVNRE
jgi:hypothetical protein